MEEALRTTVMLLWAFAAVNSGIGTAEACEVIAEESSPAPTVIYAIGKKSPTETDEFVVEQPADSPNPLGNPIVAPENTFPEPNQGTPRSLLPENLPSDNPAPIDEKSALGTLQPGQVPLPQPSNQIENEMYRSGNDIVDVQEYPIEDINQMIRPIDPATLVNQPGM